jgi:two-component system alkaline phosphatase synthesis response regulator PhoP
MARRILIVDDEPNIVISLEYLLRREGYEVSAAEDGEAALRAIAESRPDLVVLDVMLPKLNGFEVCRRVRADPRLEGLRILMLTAKGRDTEVAKGLEVGADAYVTKPFSTRDLVAQIAGMLRS